MNIDSGQFEEPSPLGAPANIADRTQAPVLGSLGKATGQGFSWMSLSIVAGKLLNFVAQLVLGAILLDEEFGIFAVASSIATFLRVFNDGGVALVLVQRGQEQFQRLLGPAFSLCICFSVATGLLLAAIAPVAARIYGQVELIPLLLLFAITIPLSCPATIFKAKLRLDLRFNMIAWISVWWFVVRYLGTILLAWWGWGAMSFVLPLPIVSLFEWLVTYAVTRVSPWKYGIGWRQWPEILSSSFWVVAAAFLRAVARNGDYVVLGLLIPMASLGQYFFGYQLTVQFALLMAANIQYVLFPVLSQLASDAARQAKAIVRTIRMMVFVSSPMSLIVAVNIGSMETLCWGGKWAAAVPLMQIFSIAAPIRLLPEIIHAVLGSKGQFRKSAVLILAEGLVLMASAWLAVQWFSTNLTLIALVIAVGQVVFSIAVTIYICRGCGIRPAEVCGAFVPAWLTSTAVAAATLAFSTWFLSATPPLIRLFLESVMFIVLYLFATRAFFFNQLEELASVVPRPLEGWVRRLFLLKSSTAGC